MISNSAKLTSRTMQHTQSGVCTSDSSRDMAATKSWRKKKEKKRKKMKKKKNEHLRNYIASPTGIANNNNETGSQSPCMRPRSEPPNFGEIECGEKQTNNID